MCPTSAALVRALDCAPLPRTARALFLANLPCEATTAVAFVAMPAATTTPGRISFLARLCPADENKLSSTYIVFQPWRRLFCDQIPVFGFAAASVVNGRLPNRMAEPAHQQLPLGEHVVASLWPLDLLCQRRGPLHANFEMHSFAYAALTFPAASAFPRPLTPTKLIKFTTSPLRPGRACVFIVLAHAAWPALIADFGVAPCGNTRTRSRSTF